MHAWSIVEEHIEGLPDPMAVAHIFDTKATREEELDVPHSRHLE